MHAHCDSAWALSSTIPKLHTPPLAQLSGFLRNGERKWFTHQVEQWPAYTM